MTVVDTLTLPDQPTTGSTNYIPLGGDGYSAPIAAYSVAGFQTAGDASAGLLQQAIVCDARYCSLVSWVTGSIQQATPADADFRFNLSSLSNRSVPLMTHAGATVAIAAAFTVEINELWVPSPVVLPGGTDIGTIALNRVNVDGDVYNAHAMIYLFDIRVRELTPMGPLLWARGSQ